ncbi:MAG: hypothetical protein HY881_11945 [Deltaproteobacteria bacterium]|nr:hypothetical protein [Deltaproteobacteria bacterium]
MISDDIRWLTVDVNPYKMSPIECGDEMKQLRLILDAIEPGIIVAPLINKTWLEIVTASWYPKARKVAMGDVALDAYTVDLLKKNLQIDIATVFNESIEISVNMTEWENNLLLASGLCHQAISSQIPQLKLSSEAEKQAEIILGEWALLNKSWVACCPAGVSNVSIKKWPAEKYGQVVAWLKNEKNLDVCLLGHSNEQWILEEVREQAVKHGYRPMMWLGNDGDIPLLCSLLDKCEFYFGNDTGAMHMAGALNRPVAAIFGGGTWPRFKPAASRSIAIVQKLPCFGCNWICHFLTAPCIRSISVEKITRVLSKWIDSSIIQERSEIDIQEFPDTSIEIIRQCAKIIQDARIEQSDLRLQVASLTEWLKQSETDRNNRLEAMNSIQKRLEEVDQERQNQIGELTERLRESENDRQLRLEQIQELTERLRESENDRQLRFEQIGELTRWLKESEADRNARMEWIHELEDRLKEANQKTDMAEQAYHALENTFIVRKARRMRLIHVRRLDDNPTC